MSDIYRLPGEAVLAEGISEGEVWQALGAVPTLRRENRVPANRPSLLAVCAPTHALRLLVVICKRDPPDPAWVVVVARDATMIERAMWREGTA